MSLLHGRPFGLLPADAPDPLHCLTIGVFYGGPPGERDVSLRSGRAVVESLRQAGHEVLRVEIGDTLSQPEARALEMDVAFLALHGEFGEDGKLQHILDEVGVPYIGSGADASSRAFDKLLAKEGFEAAGVLTPAWTTFEREAFSPERGAPPLPFAPPLVVKPASSGSSNGVSLVKDEAAYAPAIAKALAFDDTVLVERYIAGRELTVAILGEEPLPVVEIWTPNGFFDRDAKYFNGETREICPAEVSPEVAAQAQALARAAHDALGCHDLSRTDMILDAQNVLWVLEVNTLPGLTADSLLPKAAAAVGLTFTQMCEYLLRRALVSARARRQKAA